MKYKVLTLVTILMITTVGIVKAENMGVPFLLQQIIQKLEEIKVAIENIQITVPEKECKWEKLNQIITEDDILTETFCDDECQQKIFFYLPKGDISYEDIKVVSAKGIVTCPPGIQVCEYYINDIKCASTYINSANLGIDFCTDAFKSGMNEITGGQIHRLYLEVEVKPANC